MSLLLMTPAEATQVYKCNINGSIQFQQSPCDAGESQKRPTTDDSDPKRQRQPVTEKAQTTSPTKTGSSVTANQQPALPSSPYRCDGRKYCTQMSSCNEAKFFLANCPGVKMDGDNDGIPCEEQWCHW